MYRDDPLDDEYELRGILGDEIVDELLAEPGYDGRRPVDVALDMLRVMQGWADDEQIAGWFTSNQRRLNGQRAIDALAAYAYEDVEDAAKAWVAAQG